MLLGLLDTLWPCSCPGLGATTRCDIIIWGMEALAADRITLWPWGETHTLSDKLHKRYRETLSYSWMSGKQVYSPPQEGSHELRISAHILKLQC